MSRFIAKSRLWDSIDCSDCILPIAMHILSPCFLFHYFTLRNDYR
jgi:hypothetical protein